jgi:hypothetical protein
MALIFRRLGRNLVSPAVAASVVAAHMAPPALRQAIASNSARIGIAIPTPEGADVLLLGASGADAIVSFSIDALTLYSSEKSLVDASGAASLDTAIPVRRGSLDRTTPIAEGDPKLLGPALMLLAALEVGLADAAVAMAVDYAKIRQQFGRPIGTFQAIKHRCADMAVAAEVAWAQTLFASLSCDGGSSASVALAHGARVMSGDAAIANSEANIQVHGGIGFTAEASPHLLVRRAQLLARIGGDRRAHREALLVAQYGSGE